jgi:D-xylulose 5-phosphate/D-fructose 6-phosphate phosphoketolase
MPGVPAGIDFPEPLPAGRENDAARVSTATRPVIQMQLPGGTGCSTARRPSFTAPIRCPASTPHSVNVISQQRWRRRIASLSYPLALPVPQDDHNGFTHQDPGVLGYVSKKASRVRRRVRLLLVLGQRPHRRRCGNIAVAGNTRRPAADHGRGGRAPHRGHRLWESHPASGPGFPAPHGRAGRCTAAAGSEKPVIGVACPMRGRPEKVK